MHKHHDINEVIARDDTPAPQGPQSFKEQVYERMRMPLWALDIILVLLGIALVAALVLGATKGNRGM